MPILRGCNPFARLNHFIRDHSLTVIIWSLVGNTALAQLFYNSAGVILPNTDWRVRYLVFSAVLSMIAFSLFELRIVRQLKDLLGKAKEIRATLPKWELPAHVVTLSVISLYNMYSLTLLNAAIWPTRGAPVTIPELPGAGKYIFHAVMYSLILFLAAVVAERKKTAAELAAEDDDALQAEMIEGSNAYYRELIRKGGRNVVRARQVLSSPDAAAKQGQLLAALEGEDHDRVPVKEKPAEPPPSLAFSGSDDMGFQPRAGRSQEEIEADIEREKAKIIELERRMGGKPGRPGEYTFPEEMAIEEPGRVSRPGADELDRIVGAFGGVEEI